MKKFDIGYTIQILANVGVIAGIVFLAFELRQNNEHMAAQGRFNRVSLVAQQFRTLAEDSDLTELRVQAGNGKQLSEVEQRRVDAALMATFVILQWEFEELPEDSAEIANMREVMHRNFANDATYLNIWNDRKGAFNPEFVQWMEDNVVNSR